MQSWPVVHSGRYAQLSGTHAPSRPRHAKPVGQVIALQTGAQMPASVHDWRLPIASVGQVTPKHGSCTQKPWPPPLVSHLKPFGHGNSPPPHGNAH